MNNKKPIKTKYVIMGLIAVVALVLLSIALITHFKDGKTQALMHAETAYVLLVLLILLPVLLIVLAVAALTGNKKPQIIRAENVTSAQGNVTFAKSNSEDGEESEEESYEEDGEQKAEGEEVKRGQRFFRLSRIDEEKEKFRRDRYDDINLKSFCDSFRNFACSKLKLYYSIDDIRRFIAGLAVTKLIILQGISGTGKTSLAYAFGKFLENDSTVIPVQPMWKERTDLIGYYNEFTKRFNETTLLQKMYEANYSKDVYITVLDEMNIARVEYYFAEFLSLLELPNPEERYLDVVSDTWEDDPVQLVKGRIKLPPNMWFIGTANNDDSTFAISDKVYDRAMVLNLDQKSAVFQAPQTRSVHLSAERFMELAKDAETEYALTKRNLKRLNELDKYLIEAFQITFGNRIMKQIKTYIPVYVACGGEELDALDDILAKKVMRKLEMQNPIYVRNAAPGFIQKLDELFGEDKMQMCKAVIHRLEKNA